MANTISSAFRIIASMDGSTISGSLRVDGYPLIQRYTEGTEKYIPDFASLAESDRPTVYPVLRDQSNAQVLVPNQYVWKYNDVELTFGSNGLSTNSGMAGKFKRIDAYRVNISGQQYSLQALRVMGNLASSTNHDNDSISLDGSIEVSGSSVSFKGISKDVIIQQSTGNQYSAVIVNNNESALTNDVSSITEQLQIYKDGVLLTDRTGITYKWYIIRPTGNRTLGTAATQTITRDDIDSYGVVACDISAGGSVVATAYDPVTDYGDPYDVRWDVTGMTGDRCQPGETPTIKPVPVKRSTQQDNESLVSTWNWAVWDNKGAGFTLSGKTGSTFTAKSVTTSYNEIISASGGLSFIVSASYNI